MSKDIDYPLVVIKNEDVEASSLLSLNGNNNEDYEKQDMVIDIYFEAIVHSIKRAYFISAWLIFLMSYILVIRNIKLMEL